MKGVFFLSGLSSLIYQVVWQRLLTLYYGVGSVSITLIVSVYMLGLGFGALAGGALAERVKNKILFYVSIEILLGLFGLISLPYLGFLGERTAGSSYAISFLGMFLFLSPPTFLMGMTLPIIVKIFRREDGGFEDTVSFLYFVNTLGAALGALLASYGLISFFGLDTGIYAAAFLNLALAGAVYFISRHSDHSKTSTESFAAQAFGEPGKQKLGAIYFWIFLAGFLGIGYEIIWCRIVEVLVKASPYAFSTVLFVYLLGIALGSLAMNRFFKKSPRVDKKNLFFLLQAAAGIYVLGSVAAYYQLTGHTHLKVFTQVSFWESIHPPASFPRTGSLAADFFLLFDILLWPFFFFFVPTLCLGACFPVISKLALSRPGAEGEAVGTAYFFMSAGNLLGGLVTGLCILPFWGTESALFAFGLTGLGMGLAAREMWSKSVPVFVEIILVCSLLALFFQFFPRRGELYKTMHIPPGNDFSAFLEEGREGVVMTYRNGDRVRNYINGLGHGGRPGYEFYREAVEVARFARNTGTVLIIGFGTGSIVEAVSKLEGVENITVVELNGTLMKNLKKMEVFRQIISDPRIHLIMDDGRRFLAGTKQRFDLILMDPLRSSTAYSNNLYSYDFFKQVGRSLREDGVFMIWMDERKVMPKTIAAAFKYMRLYNYFALASAAPFSENIERAGRLLKSLPESMREEILRRGKYLGDETYVKDAAQGYPINRDLKPVCEYYLGLKLRTRGD